MEEREREKHQCETDTHRWVVSHTCPDQGGDQTSNPGTCP